MKGKIDRGMFVPEDKEVWGILVAGFEGKTVEMKLEMFKEERTSRQTRYYFGVVVKMISEETGHSIDEIHDFLKTMFLKKFVVVGKKRYVLVRSTTELKLDEMSKYIESCKRWAAMELSLSIPDPDEI